MEMPDDIRFSKATEIYIYKPDTEGDNVWPAQVDNKPHCTEYVRSFQVKYFREDIHQEVIRQRDELQAKLDKANWRDINFAPIDVWVLINVSGDVVRAIKRDSSGIYYWFPHDPEGRSRFTWATDMVLGWMLLPDAPEQP